MVSALHPATLQDAYACLQRPHAVPVAGATDWMIAPPADACPVFLGRIDALRQIEASAEGVHMGAGCTFAQLLRDERTPALLKAAMHDIASPAIRNRATLGGNIVNASPAADTLPALYLLDATLTLCSQTGTRTLPIDQFITGVKQTILCPDELLVSVFVPKMPGCTRFEKVGARRAQAISKCSFAGMMHAENGTIANARFAFGAVGKTVVRSRDTESQLIDLPVSSIPKRLPNIVADYAALLHPIDDQRSTAEYRRSVCLQLLQGFLQETSSI